MKPEACGWLESMFGPVHIYDATAFSGRYDSVMRLTPAIVQAMA